MKLLCTTSLGLLLSLKASALLAAPFDSCPVEAFLTQGKPATIYGVDLSTGAFNPAGDPGTSNKLNAMGFSTNDGYLYAWYYEGQTLARIHADFSLEPLVLDEALPSNFYVGDVAVAENAYYVYRKSGSLSGLWRIALDPQAADYLQPLRLYTGADVYLNIFDFAFHPDNGYLYSVDRGGNLYRISTVTAEALNLGNVGESGTFGAVYFDNQGTLYISRNNDGRIFSVDVSATNPVASFFSYGPSSSNNDGARCALAPVPPPAAAIYDFGDAPQSYGTLEDDDGPRHLVTAGLHLGQLVDAERRAFLAPAESDDVKDDSDDEDGLAFLTEFTVGEDAVLQVTASGTGYLGAWLDSNRDGVFSPTEQVLTDFPLSDSSELMSVSVPEDAGVGSTWLRVRFSSESGLGPLGAAPDGEVEDYPLEIRRPLSSTEQYPSASDVVTLAFEDLWPSRGDYDMNDFIAYYRTAITSLLPDDPDGDAIISEIRIEGEFAAVGALFHSGFAVSIPGLRTRDVNADGVVLLINGERPTGFDSGYEDTFQPLRGTAARLDETALFEITRDIWNTVERGEGCAFHRTESGCGAAANAEFSLTIPVVGDVPSSAVKKGVFNPFIFATNGYLRNSIFRDVQGNPVAPGEGLEIHLKNQPPSWRGDQALLSRADDVSQASTVDTAAPLTYQTASGLPWAMEIGGRWCHPSEYQDLTVAYPDFANFVNSDGQESADWFYVSRAASHPLRGVAGYLFKEDGVLDSNCAGGN